MFRFFVKYELILTNDSVMPSFLIDRFRGPLPQIFLSEMSRVEFWFPVSGSLKFDVFGFLESFNVLFCGAVLCGLIFLI